MDVNDFRKHAILPIEAVRKIDAIRQVIRRERYAGQDKRESLKESFKPITDKLEEEIGELTDEIKDLKMLPAPRSWAGPDTPFGPKAQLEASAPAQLSIEASSSSTPDRSKRKMKTANPDAGFTPEDLKVIESRGLQKPSDLFKTEDPRHVEGAIMRSAKLLQSLGGRKGSLSKKKSKTAKDFEDLREIEEELSRLRRYGSRLRSFPEGFKTIEYQGSGLGRQSSSRCSARTKGPRRGAYARGAGRGRASTYNQPKRNAYQIGKNGEYGRLTIDLPGLFNHLRLTASKDGKKVFDKRVDFDTIDLLTKRFNSKKKYSPLSRQVFDELNTLGELPVHRTSKKFSKIGSGVVYFNDPGDLSDRLVLLGGSIKSGNDSVRNEFSAVARALHELGEITRDRLNGLLRKYLMK